MDLKSIMNKMRKKLQNIENEYAYLTMLSNKNRHRDENLLRTEFLKIFMRNSPVEEYGIERKYTHEKNMYCDLWIKDQDNEYWIEFKCIPVDWVPQDDCLRAEHSKAMTTSREKLEDDCKRLKKLNAKNLKKYTVFSAYPLWQEREERFKEYLNSVKDNLGKKDIKINKIHFGEIKIFGKCKQVKTDYYLGLYCWQVQ